MDRPRRSSEFQHYRRTLTCPRGHRGTLRFLEGTGPVITNLQLRDRFLLDQPPRVVGGRPSGQFLAKLRQLNHEAAGAVAIPRFREDSSIECLQCNERWPVFLDERWTFEIVRDRDLRRTETPLGTDRHMVDSRESIADARKSIRVHCRWVRRLEVSWESVEQRETHANAAVTVPLPIGKFVAQTGQRVETQLRSHYLASQELETSTDKEISNVLLPAGRRTEILVHWKQIWQESICDVRLIESGQVVEVPYRRAVDVGYDYEIRHL